MPLTTPNTVNPYVIPGQGIIVFGFNPDVSTGTTPEDLWGGGGKVIFPTAAAVVDIVSTSADDAPGGIGAEVLRLVGVDANFNEITEDVTLNGLTPVASVQEFLFVNVSQNIVTGSEDVNQGNITYNIGGSFCNFLPAGKGQTQTAAVIIPQARRKGTVAHLLEIFATIGKQQSAIGTFELSRRNVDTQSFIKSLNLTAASDGTSLNLPLKVPLTFTAGDQIVMTALEVSANNILVTGSLQFGWLPVAE